MTPALGPDKVKHSWNSGSATETRLTYDPDTGLRNTEKTQGTAYLAALGRSSDAGIHVDYSFTDRLEVDSSGKYRLNPDWTVGAPRNDTARDYNYDPIGNRDSLFGYTANSLNQYTAAPNLGTFGYDANGNMTSDGVRGYAYDAENRLVSVSQGGSTWNYVYDYLGRRIQKSGTGIATTKYLYDGWNPIAELDTSNNILRKFVWGLDVSGTLQGAGGVGGLLQIDASGSYYPVYDASHNVVALYNASGAFAAAYEYDPFGNLIGSANGSYGAANPFRSATKFMDSETGLVYYGLRYYHPGLGRFINRDPIEEAGGVNLYAFCKNDVVNQYDLLGMDGTDRKPPPPPPSPITKDDSNEIPFFKEPPHVIIVYGSDPFTTSLWSPLSVNDPTGQFFADEMNSARTKSWEFKSDSSNFPSNNNNSLTRGAAPLPIVGRNASAIVAGLADNGYRILIGLATLFAHGAQGNPYGTPNLEVHAAISALSSNVSKATTEMVSTGYHVSEMHPVRRMADGGFDLALSLGGLTALTRSVVRSIAAESNLVRGTTDIGDLSHYVWKSPTGKSFDLMLNSEVSDGTMVINDAHIMPTEGTFDLTRKTLGRAGLRQLATDMADTFGVDTIEIPNSIGRGSSGAVGSFGQVRITIIDGKVVVTRM